MMRPGRAPGGWWARARRAAATVARRHRAVAEAVLRTRIGRCYVWAPRAMGGPRWTCPGGKIVSARPLVGPVFRVTREEAGLL